MWRSDNEPKWRSLDEKNEKIKSNGINPTSFYTMRRNRNSGRLTTAEKQLSNILQLAARNEVVQKRHEFTSIVNLKRDAYREVTKYKIFPLQNMAIEYLAEMKRDYIGHVNDTTECCEPLKHDRIVSTNKKNHCEFHFKIGRKINSF